MGLIRTGVLVLCLLTPITGHTAEVCVTPDLSGWSIRQRNQLQAITYQLLFEAGDDIVPTLSGSTICVENPTQNINAILNLSALVAKRDLLAQIEQTATAAEQARQMAFEQELSVNTLCHAELDELDSRIDTLIDPVSTLAEAKAAMKAALKRLARCVRARAR